MKHPNNVAARLENPRYGKHTLTTLKKIAAACDVGLVTWFVPFSRLVDWVSGVPYLDRGLTPEFYEVPTFAEEFEVPLGRMPVQSSHSFLEDHGSAGRQGQDLRALAAQGQCAAQAIA